MKAYDEKNAQSPLSNVAELLKFGQVNDLQFNSQTTSNVTLSFTAPGEEVSRFELRYSNDSAQLANSWSDAEMIDDTQLVDGTLEPVGPGQRVQVQLNETLFEE